MIACEKCGSVNVLVSTLPGQARTIACKDCRHVKYERLDEEES